MNSTRQRVHYLLCVFTIIAGSDIAAADKANNVGLKDLLITSGKIVAGGIIGGVAPIALKRLSPDTSLASIGAVCLGVTLLAIRTTTMVDINKNGHGGGIPVISEVMSEANWFNLLGIAIAAAEYGLYEHGHKLTTILKGLSGALNNKKEG